MKLNFQVKNQILSRADDNVLVNQSRNYVQCGFTFLTEEWRNINKYVIFKNEDDESFELFLGTGCYCECIIPSQVLTGDYFLLSVHGGDLITTDEKRVVLLEAGYTTEITPIKPYEKDIFIIIFEELAEKANTSDISEVGFSGSYEDLVNVPTEFPPTSHNHTSSEVSGIDEIAGNEIRRAYRILNDKIRTYGE